MTLNITHWNGGSGAWGKASNWSNGAPDAGSDAVIDATGAYGVTIAQGSAYSVGAVELNDAGATLALQGALTVGQSFDLAAGTLALNLYGVLSGGTLLFDGGDLRSQAGTFDHVSAVGPFAFTGDFQSLRLTSGFEVTAAGGGAGQIVLDGEDDTLTFDGSQTFDNATITMSGNGTSIFGGIIECTGVLTLGPHATVTTVGTETEEILGGSTIVSQGTIVSRAGSFFGIDIDPNAFVNEGVITADNFVDVGAKSFVNASGAVVDIAKSVNVLVEHGFHNAGLITIGAGAELRLAGDFQLADLGSIQNGGQIRMEGTLDNSGQVLTLGAGALAGSVSITGTILGGVVRPGSDPAQAYGATLVGVTWQGRLSLDAQFASFAVENGLTLTSASGNRRGKAVVDGNDASLLFEGVQTFDNATVELEGAGASLTLVSGKHSGATLTLGAGAVVTSRQPGSRVGIEQTTVGGGATLINQGLISAHAANSSFTIFEGAIVNSGSIRAENGDQLTLDAGSFTNTGLISVFGGAGLDIFVGDNESMGVFTNAGTISVAASASLSLEANASLASLGALTDKGTLALHGTLDAAGASVALGQGPIFGGQALVLGLGGFLQNGTFTLGKPNIVYSGGGFAQASVRGALDLTAAGATAALGGGVSLTNGKGAGAGRINITGAGATLNFFDTRGVNSNAIDNVLISIGNTATAAKLQLFSYSGRPQTLTLGSGVHIVSRAAGALAVIGSQFGAVDTVVNDGAITAAAQGGAFTIADALANNGSITVKNGDSLVIQGALAGTGEIDIAGSGILELSRSAAAGQTIAFEDATGLLRLDAPASFAATVAGVRMSDAIDLVATAATSAHVNAQDQLVVLNGSSTVATLQLAGDYSQATFTVGSDRRGGSLITLTQARALSLAQASASFAHSDGAAEIPPVRPEPRAIAQLLAHG